MRPVVANTICTMELREKGLARVVARALGIEA